MVNKPQIQKKNSAPESGFTLVELLMVVAIIALIAGFTMGEINSTSHKLKGATQTLRAKMQQAKLLAIKENCNVFIDFDLDSNGTSNGTLNASYCIWRDVLLPAAQTFTMKNIAGAAVTSKDKSVEFVEEIALPSDISIGTVNNSDGGPSKGPPTTDPTIPTSGISYGGDRISFSPQGTSSSGWTYLHAPSNDSSGTYAVGTNRVGRVRSWYWVTNGGKWR